MINKLQPGPGLGVQGHWGQNSHCHGPGLVELPRAVCWGEGGLAVIAVTAWKQAWHPPDLPEGFVWVQILSPEPSPGKRAKHCRCYRFLTYVLLVLLALGGHGLLWRAVQAAVGAAVPKAICFLGWPVPGQGTHAIP
jgi:hypothetical protein